MISTSDLCQLLTLLASVALSSATVLGENDNCMFQESTVHIDKDMVIRHQGQQKLARCMGNVSMKKCEGTCESSVTPSVQYHSGFRRNCRCCRENGTLLRSVMLTCYSGGYEIRNFQQPISVKEVTGCHCQPCLD